MHKAINQVSNYVENIEHDYLTHTYVIYSVVSIIDS